MFIQEKKNININRSKFFVRLIKIKVLSKISQLIYVNTLKIFQEFKTILILYVLNIHLHSLILKRKSCVLTFINTETNFNSCKTNKVICLED